MPTLQEYVDAHERTGKALRAAQDRLGQARDNALTAILKLAEMESRKVTEDVDPDDLALAQSTRDDALAALAKVEADLQP